MLMKQIIIAIVITALSITGCGSNNSRPSDLPQLYPCVLTVTQEGNPLSGAYVTLIPMEESNAKYQASSVTDNEGKATIITYGFDGVPAGKYKVCVRKVVGDENREYQLVEPKYSDSKNTPHELEITGKQMPPASFDVGKSVKPK